MKKIIITLMLVAVMLSACGKGDTVKETTAVEQPETNAQDEPGDTADNETNDERKDETADTTEDTAEETSEVVELPILDEIDQKTQVGVAGASLKVVPIVVDLMDWGTGTDLDPEAIKKAATKWMAEKQYDDNSEFMEKIMMVDGAYRQLIGDTDDGKELLESAGCEDAAYPWCDAPVDSIEAIMEAVGLR